MVFRGGHRYLWVVRVSQYICYIKGGQREICMFVVLKEDSVKSMYLFILKEDSVKSIYLFILKEDCVKSIYLFILKEDSVKSVTAVEGGFKSSDDNYTYIRGSEIIFIFKILIFIWNILIFLYSSNRRLSFNNINNNI